MKAGFPLFPGLQPIRRSDLSRIAKALNKDGSRAARAFSATVQLHFYGKPVIRQLAEDIDPDTSISAWGFSFVLAPAAAGTVLEIDGTVIETPALQ
jgi:hypothetical protein